MSLRDSRVLRPQEHWQTLDLVLAAIALAFLGFALVGLSNVAGALNDTRALQQDCPDSECVHHGKVSGSTTYLVTRYSLGSAYCIITMDLDIGQRQAALAGKVCQQIPAGSPIDATYGEATSSSSRARSGRWRPMATLGPTSVSASSGCWRSFLRCCSWP